MTKNLRKQTLHALSWSFFAQFGQQGTQVIVQLLLARMLGPEAFGLVAMLAIFNALAQIMVSHGFGIALIQQKEISQKDISSVFYFNLFLGFCVAGLMCAASPWIASFYRKPELAPLTCFLSLAVIFSSLAVIQDALLRRRMNFKGRMKAMVPATMLSGLLGIGLAVAGFGVWALAWQMVSLRFFSAILLWVISRWKPTLEFSWKSINTMFHFGSKMLASGLLATFFDNVYLIVIGRLYSAVTLGLYSNARRLQFFIANNIASIVSSVMFPVFSKIQHEPERLRKAASHSLKALMMINSMVMFGLIAVAPSLFTAVLGDKWIPSIPYFQWLCLAGMTLPLHVLNLNILMGMGHSNLFLRLEIIKKTLVVANIAITYRWGVSAMIYGQVILSYFAFYINSFYTGKMLNYGVLRQSRDILPYVMISGVVAVAMWGVGMIVPWNIPIVILACQCVLGLLLWVSLSRTLRMEAFMVVWSLALQKLKSLRGTQTN